MRKVGWLGTGCNYAVYSVDDQLDGGVLWPGDDNAWRSARRGLYDYEAIAFSL